MIPPSLTLIVYGVTINESIVQLFMAGILPGLVLAGLFMIYVGVWATINKKKMPPKDPQISFLEKVKSSKFLIPIFSLIVFVIPELREAITSAERFISIPFTFATIASNKIKNAKVGMA